MIVRSFFVGNIGKAVVCNFFFVQTTKTRTFDLKLKLL